MDKLIQDDSNEASQSIGRKITQTIISSGKRIAKDKLIDFAIEKVNEVKESIYKQIKADETSIMKSSDIEKLKSVFEQIDKNFECPFSGRIE